MMEVQNQKGECSNEIEFYFRPAQHLLMDISCGGSGVCGLSGDQALRKYTRSVPVRKEKAENAKTLGEVLKQHRLNCKMTQEFVAETLGVSRQAVSKWESGASAPSTTNLMALAKVFDVSAEELLKETQKN